MKTNKKPEPRELWEPLENDWPGWFILGDRQKLLGRLTPGIADTADQAVTEFLRRAPILAARLSPADREQLTAIQERAA